MKFSNANNKTCNFSPGTSYYGVIEKYVQAFKYFDNRNDQSAKLRSWPIYTWSEILLIIAMAMLLIRIKIHLTHLVQKKVRYFFPTITQENAVKMSPYLIKLIESLLLSGTLFYLLVYKEPCPAIWDFHLLTCSEAPYSLHLVQFSLLARTASHFYDLLIHYQHERRRDTNILLIHHLVTIALLYSSRVELLYSMWIQFVHEVSEPFFNLGKVVLILVSHLKDGNSLLARKLIYLRETCLFGMAAVWFYCRLYLFPCRIIYAGLDYFNTYQFNFIMSGATLLMALMIIHLIWTFFLLKTLLLRLCRGKFVDSTRIQQTTKSDQKVD